MNLEFMQNSVNFVNEDDDKKLLVNKPFSCD